MDDRVDLIKSIGLITAFGVCGLRKMGTSQGCQQALAVFGYWNSAK